MCRQRLTAPLICRASADGRSALHTSRSRPRRVGITRRASHPRPFVIPQPDLQRQVLAVLHAARGRSEPALLLAPSGRRSTFLAGVTRVLRDDPKAGRVIAHFAGASEGSTSISRVLRATIDALWRPDAPPPCGDCRADERIPRRPRPPRPRDACRRRRCTSVRRCALMTGTRMECRRLAGAPPVCRQGQAAELWNVRNHMLELVFAVVFLFYPSCSAAAFSAFSCEDFERTRYLENRLLDRLRRGTQCRASSSREKGRRSCADCRAEGGVRRRHDARAAIARTPRNDQATPFPSASLGCAFRLLQ